jgi:3-phenylpropionate/trans-cinnamate dioxygenase ferredoxin reductase subunit
MSNMDSVVVVGASLAGLRALQALRRAGFAGRVTVIGEESEPPYDRPPLSKEVLAGKWDAARTALLREEDAALEVDWQLGKRAEALDLAGRRVVLDGGLAVPFDGLVIATGTYARRLPNMPPLAGVHVLRTLADCLALRAELDRSPRVAVIGAGFIGLEVAATCRGRGLAVSVIESLAAPLERGLGAALGTYVGEIHRDHGVDLRLGARVARLVGGERVEAVELADGARLPADVVVVGIGAAPATAWLESSGLELADGVVCDAACRATRAPFVVAAGDVARWTNPLFGASQRIEHWTNATEQADHAVATLLAGAGGASFAPVPFVWSDQYDRKLQVAGRLEGADETQVVDGSLAERRFVMLFGRGGRVTGVVGMNRPRLVMRARALIRDRAPFAGATV